MSPALGRQKRLLKRGVKRVSRREILLLVLLGFAEDAILDQVEDDLSKILAPAHAPRLQHGLGERAKLLKGVHPQPIQQLLSGDVPGLRRTRPVALLHLAHGIIQPTSDKRISTFVVAAIFLADLVNDHGEIRILHAERPAD